MPDYERMYALLCGAVDEAIDSLVKIPAAEHISQSLEAALLEAEEIYIRTSPYIEETVDSKILKLKVDIENEK